MTDPIRRLAARLGGTLAAALFGLQAISIAVTALVFTLPGPVAAQDAAAAPEVFVPRAVPGDWPKLRLEGLDLRLPPGLSVLEDYSDTKVWGRLDETSRTGVMFGLEFDKAPERALKRDNAQAAGAIMLPNGHVLRRWQMQAPPEAGVPGRAEVLVTDLPVRGEDRLAISVMTMNTDFKAAQTEFETFVSGIMLPAPGSAMRRDVFDGVLRLPFGTGWNGLGSSAPDSIWMFVDDLPGRLRIERGAAETAGLRTGTPGQAISFLGQPAQLFGYEDGSETVDDGTGQTGQTRIVVLETCLPDGGAVSILFSGMPGFFHDARVISPFADGLIVMPEGARPCAPGILPEGAQIAAPGSPRPAVLPPFDVAPVGAVQPRAEGTALGGLITYHLPIGWTAAPEPGDTGIGLAGPTGETAELARSAARIGAPGGLAAGVPKDAWPRSDIILGWPVRRFDWSDGGQEQRLYLYEHCLPGDEPFGLKISASKAFFEGKPFGDLYRGLKLAMPDAARPCPEPMLGDLIKAAAQDAQPAMTAPAQTAPAQSAPLQIAPVAPAATPGAAPEAEPDQFFPGQGGYALYQNARYGTFISYPASYFLPDPPPGNNDGRAFTSVDGWARFYVFASYNAEALTPAQQMARDIEAHGSASYSASGPGWYVISGAIGSDIYYRRVIEDMSGLIRVFEISYPQARKTEFDAVVAYMANSFGPGSGD